MERKNKKKLVKLVCKECNKKFLQSQKQYNQNRKRKVKGYYCSKYCQTRQFVNPDAPFNFLLNSCKQNSIKRKKIFEITANDLKKIYKKQKGKCIYSNIQMEMPHYKKKITPFTMSIDRTDSSLGYIKDNIELVCIFINWGKHHFSKEQTFDFLKKINFYMVA